ncbi:WD40 repeat domain-containing protein [Streptomyces longispororuber]|uniref:WD40 repeat domain-containing protein n=1 Tax=Streptomyces longispororuber TaxID=68230 RepID=UPI00210C5013|nr:WD40 repeat domain-containing protein [Streptomyces longispororuber]MCQ4210506.1 WD40 repeat domain-containing protein [Streptomyces longispororuber]
MVVPPPSEEGGEQQAPQFRGTATGDARVFQAGRDQHIAERDLHLHYPDGVREARRVLPGADTGECPYPGLPAFEVDQARWFFGRERLTAELVERLDERLREGGMLAVVGPSGAGKSSLVQAGLLPDLAHGALPAAGSSRWPQLVLRPTADPVGTLTAKVAEALPMAAPPASRSPEPLAWTASVRAALREGGTGRRMVVVVDQLEELFTVCDRGSERHAFLDMLAALAQADPRGDTAAALVVLVLRADFYAACSRYPQLRAALGRGQVLIGPLSEVELREAILFPARTVGLDMEPGLVELLLSDLGVAASIDADEPYEAGRLPLLAHALRGTWQRRHGHTLTVAGYRATGGIHQAVAATAERLFTALDPDAQRAAGPLFLRLVTLGEGTQATRRRIANDRVETLGDMPLATVSAVEAFTTGRLLTRRQDGVEITHEALLHAWPRLRHWIEDDRAGHLLHQRLEESAADWDGAARDAGRLYRGHRLAAARVWADSSPGHLSRTASAFLAASVRHQRRALGLRRAVVATLTILALLASAAAVIALQQRSTARTQRDSANFSRVTAQADRLRGRESPLAAQFDVVGHRMRHGDAVTRLQLTADANGPLATPLRAHAGPVRALAYSPDGRVLASGGSDGKVRLWDMTRAGGPRLLGEPLLTKHQMVTGLAFSVNGKVLACGGNAGTVQVWNVTDQNHPQPVGRPVGGDDAGLVMSVSLSPDGRTLAAVGSGGVLRLWRVVLGAGLRSLNRLVVARDGPATDVAFSPDGRTLAVAGDGLVHLWDVTNLSRPHPLGKPSSGQIGSVSVLEFSPDSKTLAVAGVENTAALLDLTDRSRPKPRGDPLTGHTAAITSLAFSHDGRTLATGSVDCTVRRWDVDPWGPATTPIEPPLTGHASVIETVAVSPDGRTIASGDDDRTILLWSFPDTVLGKAEGALSMAFTPRGDRLLTGTTGLSTWRVTDPAHPRPLTPRGGYPDGMGPIIALSPDGRTLAAAEGWGRVVHLWDVTDLAHPVAIAPPLTGHTDGIEALRFSPDRRTLASLDNGGTVRLWDVRDRRRARPIGTPLTENTQGSTALAFSPSGRTLATAGKPRQILLWRVADPAHPRLITQLNGHAAPVQSVAFTPDGQNLASAASDGTVRLWKLTPGKWPEPAGPPLVGRTGTVRVLAVSHDGRLLATGGADHQVRLWDITRLAHPVGIERPLAILSDPIWALAFSPDDRTLAGATGSSEMRLWHLSPDDNARQVCAATAPALTPEIWNRYLSGLKFAPPCHPE